jgi:hypothetical protein
VNCGTSTSSGFWSTVNGFTTYSTTVYSNYRRNIPMVSLMTYHEVLSNSDGV